MNRIQKISSYLSLIFSISLVGIPLLSIIRWILIGTKIFDKFIQTPEGYVNLSNVAWTPMPQLLGFSADLLGLLPLLISLFYLKIIFKNYQNGKIFNIKNAVLYRRLGVLFLIDALLISPLNQALIVLAVTLTNSPGHRYLAVSFGTPNLASLFYGIIVIIVSWVMLEASKIYEEQKLII